MSVESGDRNLISRIVIHLTSLNEVFYELCVKEGSLEPYYKKYIGSVSVNDMITTAYKLFIAQKLMIYKNKCVS